MSLGRPRPMLEFIFDSTRTVSDLVFNRRLQQYPNIPWIFTHGGGTLPLLTQRMELFRSVFAAADDTSACSGSLDPIPEQVGRLWFDIAGTPLPSPGSVPCSSVRHRAPPLRQRLLLHSSRRRNRTDHLHRHSRPA
ncbi:hypothetical protein [Streptomyces sp. NPDC056405]|uniref:hypothetical protein n=1 Tax=Streptomyces sp. NPDC056405 TaxID=3345811 RepID=UPI0035DA350B